MTTRIVAGLALVAVLPMACTPVGALVGSGAVVARSVVQERSTMDALTDLEIELAIAARLGEHSGELFRDVSVDVTEGRVVLAGTVPRREDRVAARSITWSVGGVRAVEDALEVAEDSGAAGFVADASISNRLRWELLRDRTVRSINFNVETVDGTVHLTGLARSSAELERAVTIARGVGGVSRVVSHVLLIDDPRRLATLAPTRPG